MITKERLEELIEKNCTVYMANRYTEGIFLDKSNFEVTDKELVFKYKIYAVLLEDLFETKEDAEEYAEFGNITRTERLPYFPKYENIEYERGYFIRKFHIKDNYDGFGKLMVIKDFVILVQCSSLGVLHEEYFNKPATRENYNEARRLCIKLFKGEEV